MQLCVVKLNICQWCALVSQKPWAGMRLMLFCFSAYLDLEMHLYLYFGHLPKDPSLLQRLEGDRKAQVSYGELHS